MSESDGMDEAVEAGMRSAMMAAARIGEQVAKMREQDQREIQQAEEQRARQLQERFTASQAAARVQLEPVGREDWDKATPEMIERAHETATAWKDHDPVVAEQAEQIREQVQQRYGFDVNSPGASESEISDALSRAQQGRGLAENERSQASAARADEVVAAAAVAGASREDRQNAAASSAGAAGRPMTRPSGAETLQQVWKETPTGRRSTHGSRRISTKAPTPARLCNPSPGPRKRRK